MGTLFIIIAGSLWGAMGIFVRGLASCGLSSIEICFVRMVMASFLMTIYFVIFNRNALKIRISDIWCFVGTGVLSLTFFGYCYFTTIQMTSMSIAAVLLYTSPIFVLLLSVVLFKEKITRRKVISIIVAITGCAFVSGIIGNGDANLSFAGILFGLGSGLGYGLYSIFSRYAINRGYSALTITYYSFVFSAIALVFIAKPVNTILKLTNGRIDINIYYVIGTAVVVTILPYIFYTLGLTKIENSKASVLACIEPIMATVFGYLFFHEVLNYGEVVGVILVLIAIIL